jgi:hypothetical protein
LDRELIRVADAAGAVGRALDEANTLAADFPDKALRDLCTALAGLPIEAPFPRRSSAFQSVDPTRFLGSLGSFGNTRGRGTCSVPIAHAAL